MTSTLNVYTTPPQQERKAAKEARQSGFKAAVPTEKKSYRGAHRTVSRRVPVAPGYVFAEGKPYEAKHIRANKGAADRQEVRRLYVRTSVTQRRHAFAPGDAVKIKRGAYVELPGTIAEIHRAHWYDVRVMMFGKSHIVKLRESDLARAHPGT